MQDEVELRAFAARAAGTSNYSVNVDMAGYESVQWIIPVSTHTNAGTVAATFGEGASTSSFQTLTATSANVTGTTVADSMVMLVDIIRPKDQFVQCTITRATQNSSIGPIVACLYGAAKMSVGGHTTAFLIDDTDQSISPST